MFVLFVLILRNIICFVSFFSPCALYVSVSVYVHCGCLFAYSLRFSLVVDEIRYA